MIAPTEENYRAVLDAVRDCPHRGGVLPVSRQREGCRCGELSECRAGKGKSAGEVTTADCVACRCERIWGGGQP